MSVNAVAPRGPGLVRSYGFTAPNAPETPRLAREHVAALVGAAGLWGLVDGVRLLVSEVVTNVYRHTSVPQLTVRTAVHPDRVVVSVEDGEPCGMPGRPGESAVDPEGGRGLVLLAAVAAVWGITWRETEKVVWFELRAGEG